MRFTGTVSEFRAWLCGLCGFPTHERDRLHTDSGQPAHALCLFQATLTAYEAGLIEKMPTKPKETP